MSTGASPASNRRGVAAEEGLPVDIGELRRMVRELRSANAELERRLEEQRSTEHERAEEVMRHINEKLERRAHYDPVTHMPNRLLFRDRLEHEMERAGSGGERMALLLIDLDRFKEVNDQLGHDAGDALLAHVARRICGRVQPGDTVARLGGDEFSVVLAQPADEHRAEEVAVSIIDALRAPFRIDREQVIISASIGITLYPGDGGTADELLRNADQAMYRAKSTGRDRLAFFEPAMHAAAMRRIELIRDLRRAVPLQQLELYFQPIVDIRSGAIAKAEALLRWHRPGHELTMPAEFIGVAEETGLINEIGSWVFFEAANWSRRWSELLGRRFQISINKSPVQLQRYSHTPRWLGYMHEHELPRDSIAVEITEGVFLNLSEHVCNNLHVLQEGGIQVSIDDFGTGYSSMTYLKQLDVDFLKIDKSFVAEMLKADNSRIITESIIAMAHKLGLKVIAEGVEQPEQRNWLEQHGCDYLQGFLFSRPIVATDFERLLLHQVELQQGKPMH